MKTTLHKVSSTLLDAPLDFSLPPFNNLATIEAWLGCDLTASETAALEDALRKVPEQIEKGFPLNFILQLDEVWGADQIKSVQVIRAYYPVVMTLAKLGLSNKSTGLSSGGILSDGNLVGGRRSGSRGANLGRVFGLSAGFGRDAKPFDGMTVRDFILRNDSREMGGEAGIDSAKDVIHTEIPYCLTIEAEDGKQDEFISIQHLRWNTAQFLELKPIADSDNLPEGDKFACTPDQMATLLTAADNAFYPPHGFSAMCITPDTDTLCAESELRYGLANRIVSIINSKSTYDASVRFDELVTLLDKFGITQRNF